jgi:FtsZ-binding cell division protein ZapB
MFWLVPMVKTRKRIDLKREAEAWQNRLSSLIANNWKDPK